MRCLSHRFPQGPVARHPSACQVPSFRRYASREMTCQGGKFICTYLQVDCNGEDSGISIISRSGSAGLAVVRVATSGTGMQMSSCCSVNEGAWVKVHLLWLDLGCSCRITGFGTCGVWSDTAMIYTSPDFIESLLFSWFTGGRGEGQACMLLSFFFPKQYCKNDLSLNETCVNEWANIAHT